MQNSNVLLDKTIILQLWKLLSDPGWQMQLLSRGDLTGGCLGRELVVSAGGQALAVGILVLFILCPGEGTFLDMSD